MSHYHIRVGDQGGVIKPPTVKAPVTPKAKTPVAPKNPAVKPPKVPSVAPPRQGGGTPHAPGGGGKFNPVAGTIGAIGGVGGGFKRAARGAERVQSGIERASEFGAGFNRDAGSAKMGHYHFNIPSRGSRMRRNARDTIEKPKKTEPYLNESTEQSPFGRMRKPTDDTGTSEGAKKAAATRARGGTSQSKVTNPGFARRNYGAPERAAARRAANRDPDSWRYPPSASRDSGTSEGAKKAAATRRQGSTERSVRTGGNYGVDIKAGSNAREVPRRPPPEPYRGYDSRRK